jgi:arsenate reductase (glutaredoxin)
MTLTVYGIPNCDTVKKARSWLTAKGMEYTFHDYKKVGIDAVTLQGWCLAAGWEVLLNKAGTTFKKLPDTDKIDLNETRAIALMIANPSMIKRPVVAGDFGIVVGFKPEIYEKEFA